MSRRFNVQKAATRTAVRRILVSRGDPCIAAEGIRFERSKIFPAVKYFVTYESVKDMLSSFLRPNYALYVYIRYF